MSKTDLYRQIDAIKRWRKKNPHRVREYKRRDKEKKKAFKQELIDTHPEKLLWERAKANAHNRYLEFNLDLEDIYLPECCPLLGCLLFFDTDNPGGPNTPSVDRIDNSKGYVKGNVWIISHKANSMKSNASVVELKLFAENVLKHF